MRNRPVFPALAAAAALAVGACAGPSIDAEPAGAGQTQQPAPQSTPEPESSPEDQPADQGSRTKRLDLGETAVYAESGTDLVEITVSDVEVYAEPRADSMIAEPPENGSFVRFTVHVAYVGDGTADYHVNPWNWSVKADGRVYDEQAIFEEVDSELPATDLVSEGGEVTGDVVFDAPASGEIRLEPGLGGAKAFWAFGG